MSFTVSTSTIDGRAVRAALADPSCGAAVFFEGRVRDHNEGRRVERLEYEVYEPLALKEGNVIIAEAHERWGITRAVAVHRAGLLELTDIAVLVGVASPHRDEAYRASRYIIDQLKERLPIWKKEHYSDGGAQWVNCRHCGNSHGADAA